MCAGCPGGRAVSRVTAYINLHGLKQGVLKALQRAVGHRASISAFGDQWVLRTRTGAQTVLPDAEALARALVDKRLVDRSTLPAPASGAGSLPPLGPGSARLDAEGLVAALLACADAARTAGTRPH